MNYNFKIIGTGLIIGGLSGLLGIGGGVFLVPILVASFGFIQHKAQATSLAYIIPIALTSCLVYSSHGNVDFTLALQIIIGSVIGATIGAKIMKKLPAAKLKVLFGFVLIITGIRMVLN